MSDSNAVRVRTAVTPLGGRVLLGVAVLIAVTYLFASASRGIWYDENWSIFFSQHDLPLNRLLSDRWLRDNHPPASFLLGWLVAPAAGESLLGYRLTNLVPATLLLATLGLISRPRNSFAALFGLLVFTNPWCIRYFAEFRSYYSQICCAAAVVAAAHFMFTSPSDLRRRDARVLALPAVAAILVLNLHYIGASLAAVMLLTLAGGLLLSRKPLFAAAVLATTMIGLVAIAATYLVQRASLASAADPLNLWQRTSTLKAIEIVAEMLALAIGCNLAALWCVVRGFRKVFASNASFWPLGAFVCWAAFATVGMAAASIIINLVRPVLLGRYISVLLPVAIGPVAGLASAASTEIGAWLIVGNAAALAIASGYKVGQQEKWSAGARFISQQVQRCPGTVVHTVPHWRLEPRRAAVSMNEAEMNHFAYQRLGREFGFLPEPEGSRRVSEKCPTIIWAGHFYLPPPPPAFAASRLGLQIDGEPLRHSRSFTLADGVMILFPPR